MTTHAYPLPRIDDIIDSLQGQQYSVRLISLQGTGRWKWMKVAVRRPLLVCLVDIILGTVLPFGLCNEVATVSATHVTLF